MDNSNHLKGVKSLENGNKRNWRDEQGRSYLICYDKEFVLFSKDIEEF